jgi:hypothetical protein
LLIVIEKRFKIRKCDKKGRNTNLNNTKGSSSNTKTKNNNTKRNTTITKRNKYLNNIA